MKYFFLSLLLSLTVISCGKDDDNDEPGGGGGGGADAEVTVVLDGETFTATQQATTLESYGDNNDGRRLTISTVVNDASLVLSVEVPGWQNPPDEGVLVATYDTNFFAEGPNTSCMTVDGDYQCNEAVGSYFTDAGSFIADDGGTITITENDTDDRTVSGTFSMTLISLFGGEGEFEASGTFDDLSY